MYIIIVPGSQIMQFLKAGMQFVKQVTLINNTTLDLLPANSTILSSQVPVIIYLMNDVLHPEYKKHYRER